MKILFHHLAKTAGTSVITCVKRLYRGSTCPARYDPELTEERMHDPNMVFYQGHFSFDHVERFRKINPDAFVFTFVRNPLNRVISQYYNWTDHDKVAREARHLLKRGVFTADHVSEKVRFFEQEVAHMSFADFLDSDIENIRDVVEDHQTRYLSLKLTYRRDRLDSMIEACTNLASFYNFVGITEQYDDSVKRLAAALGDRRILEAQNIVENTNQTTKGRSSYRLPLAEFDRLWSLNQMDVMVYNFALGLYYGGGPRQRGMQPILRYPRETQAAAVAEPVPAAAGN